VIITGREPTQERGAYLFNNIQYIYWAEKKSRDTRVFGCGSGECNRLLGLDDFQTVTLITAWVAALNLTRQLLTQTNAGLLLSWMLFLSSRTLNLAASYRCVCCDAAALRARNRGCSAAGTRCHQLFSHLSFWQSCRESSAPKSMRANLACVSSTPGECPAHRHPRGSEG